MTTMTQISQLDHATKKMLNEKLSRVKGQLFAMPGAAWLSSLMCSHQYLWDLDCDTAWTNGQTIGWNPNFFLSLKTPARVTVLAHELNHTGQGHMIRRQNRCPDIWNIAADYVINNRLDIEKYSFDMPVQPFIDHQYDDMTTEQVYDLLVADGMKPFEFICPEGVPLSGDVREASTEEAVKGVKTAIVQAQQAAIRANQAGSIPGDAALFIDSFLKPKLNWRVLLRKYFTALAKDDYSWKRPSRRYEEYLPSLQGDNGLEHLIYFLDVSGSITDGEIVRFNSEVRSIHKNLRPERLTLVTFDTQIQDVYEYTKDQPFDSIEVHGRGGTSLEPVKEFIQKHKPTAAVVFSDMYVKPMDEDPGSPLLWIVMDNAKAQVPFGKIIHLDRENLV